MISRQSNRTANTAAPTIWITIRRARCRHRHCIDLLEAFGLQKRSGLSAAVAAAAIEIVGFGLVKAARFGLKSPAHPIVHNGPMDCPSCGFSRRATIDDDTIGILLCIRHILAGTLWLGFHEKTWSLISGKIDKTKTPTACLRLHKEARYAGHIFTGPQPAAKDEDSHRYRNPPPISSRSRNSSGWQCHTLVCPSRLSTRGSTTIGRCPGSSSSNSVFNPTTS